MQGVLLAASPAGAREIGAALAGLLDYEVVLTFEDAVEALRASPLSLIVVDYYFDTAEPFHFIRHARSYDPSVQILVVRALGLPLGATLEADIRIAYQAIGADAFINYADETSRLGLEEGRGRFREAVLRRLSPLG